MTEIKERLKFLEDMAEGKTQENYNLTKYVKEMNKIIHTLIEEIEDIKYEIND